MSRATIRIPAPLRKFTAGADEVAVTAATVGEALAALEQCHGEIRGQVLDPRDGGLRTFVNVFVGPRNVRSLDGLDTPIEEGASISIVPAVAGGAAGGRSPGGVR